MTTINDPDWADMAERASDLIASVDQAAAWIEAANRWLDDYNRAAAGAAASAANRESRWRPIDPAGNVDPQPAPEPPDDSDEGETGPDEAHHP